MVETETKTRDIPVWLTGIVLILCVAGGVWLVRWYTREQAPQAVEVPADDPASVAAAAKFKGPLANYAPGSSANRVTRDGMPAGPVDGVRPTSGRANTWNVRAGDATMYVALGRNGQLELSPSYVKQSLTPEQAQVLLMRRRLIADAAARDQIKLTPAQLEALQKVAEFRGMVVTPEDRAKLTGLFEAWRKAAGDKSAEEKALVAALADIAKRSAAPTQAFDAGRVEQVLKIVTPEQIRTFNQGLAPPGAAPAAPPPPPAGAKPTARARPGLGNIPASA